jgi:hypothetical protein
MPRRPLPDASRVSPVARPGRSASFRARSPQARGRAWAGLAGATSVTLLAAGCTSSAGPLGGAPGSVPPVTATAPAPPRATCGEARTAANVPVVVEVEKGSVTCSVAMRIQRGYTTLVQEGRVRGNGGGAPVVVDGWTCQSESTPMVVQTGEASACRQGGAEIIAVLKLPGGSG